MSISQVRAALLQPSPEFLDSVVYTEAATACLTCPPGARPGTYGTCICDIAGTFSNFEKSPTCSDAASGELQSQDRMPLGMPMPQAIEHCAAAARAYAAPVFCVTCPLESAPSIFQRTPARCAHRHVMTLNVLRLCSCASHVLHHSELRRSCTTQNRGEKNGALI